MKKLLCATALLTIPLTACSQAEQKTTETVKEAAAPTSTTTEAPQSSTASETAATSLTSTESTQAPLETSTEATASNSTTTAMESSTSTAPQERTTITLSPEEDIRAGIGGATATPSTVVIEGPVKEHLEMEPGWQLVDKGAGSRHVYKVKGVLKNNTPKTADYVQVTFPAFAKDGSDAGNCIGNASRLRPGSKTSITAACLSHEVAKVGEPKISAH